LDTEPLKNKPLDKVMEFWPIILLVGAVIVKQIEQSYKIDEDRALAIETDKRVDDLVIRMAVEENNDMWEQKSCKGETQ
jgi:hypothetical protein